MASPCRKGPYPGSGQKSKAKKSKVRCERVTPGRGRRGKMRIRWVAMRVYLSQRIARALTPTGGFLHGFAYTLNPYVGCAFGDAGGCPFCYVRALPVAQA